MVRRVRVPKVDLDDNAIGVKDLPHGGGHPGPVHPVERLGEAEDSKGAKGSGEILGPHLDPAGIGDVFLLAGALGLSQHCGIGVESNGALEEVGEEQRGGAWPATDVEEATAPIEMEVLCESVGESRGIWFTTLP